MAKAKKISPDDKKLLAEFRPQINSKGARFQCPFIGCPMAYNSMGHRNWTKHMRDDHRLGMVKCFPCRMENKCGKIFKTSKGSTNHKCGKQREAHNKGKKKAISEEAACLLLRKKKITFDECADLVKMARERTKKVMGPGNPEGEQIANNRSPYNGNDISCAAGANATIPLLVHPPK